MSAAPGPAASRRGLLALAGPAAALAAVPALAAPADPHPAWAAEIEALYGRANGTPGITDEELAGHMDRIWELETLVADTPARTLDGVAAQLGMARRVADDSIGAWPVGETVCGALGSALATLDALAGRG